MIYLDNAATTKPRKEAVDAAILAAEEFGNPSSLHGLGLRAEKLINEARDSIAKELNAEKRHIYFTSGGTEANNLAIFGAAEAMQRAGKRVITSKIEHPSVLEAFGRLSELGYDVVFADAERDGRISVDSVKSALTPDTILVSVMHVNNETGVIQPVREDVYKRQDLISSRFFLIPSVSRAAALHAAPNASIPAVFSVPGLSSSCCSPP